MSKLRLGERLLAKGYITQDQLTVGLLEQKVTGQKLGKTLIALGFLSEADAREVLGEVVGYASMSLQGVVPDAMALDLVSETFARTHLVMPISLSTECLKVAMISPDDIVLLDQLRRHIHLDIQIAPILVAENEIQAAIDHFYGYELSIDGILHELETGLAEVATARLEQAEYSQPMVRLVDNFLTDAVKREASDIHFEPEEHFIGIRYRVDGVLQPIRLIHKMFWSALVIRLKVMASLDLTDQRLPQDGRMELVVHGRRIDVRVSVLPGQHGENFVLRILDREKGIVPLAQLGLDARALRALQLMMARPYGLVLVTGPTGSGKTTTLYSMINELNQVGVNIMTLEDPVEYPMTGVRQTSINDDVGMTFANGIRSMLRQDPDIMLVGEVRDSETADMTFRAAMTGHLVLTTLHANSAVAAIPRLIDLGVSPSLLAGNIVGILAQRLVRRLCDACKQSYVPESFECELLGVNEGDVSRLYRACGCAACNDVGYKGRLAVLEVLHFDESLDDRVLAGDSQHGLLEHCLSQGFNTLTQNGVKRVLSGETSLDEISRVLNLTELVP